MPARLLRRFAPLLGLVIVCALLPLSLEGSSPPPSSPAPRPFVAPPRDPCLYEELGVSHDASSTAIRKAYYKLALAHHPDKAPPGREYEAQERFKRLAEAYEVLQDESSREAYHELGMEWRGWKKRQDPMEVFQRFMGAGRFVHIIGQLSPRLASEGGHGYQFRQAKQLAEVLSRRLDFFDPNAPYQFEASAWAEASALRQETLGCDVLSTVGYVYVNFGRRSLGKLPGGILRGEAIAGKLGYYTDTGHRLGAMLQAVSVGTALRVKNSVMGTWKADTEGPGAGEEPEDVLRMIWAIHKVEVERSVQHACRMVLRDPNQPPDVLRRRADALIVLGQVFRDCARGLLPSRQLWPLLENSVGSQQGQQHVHPEHLSVENEHWQHSEPPQGNYPHHHG